LAVRNPSSPSAAAAAAFPCTAGIKHLCQKLLGGV
jgi:hypothetical protein